METNCSTFKPDDIDNREVFLDKNGYIIFECKECGHRFLEIEDYDNHVDTVYSDEYFSEGGHGYPNYLEQKDILIQYGKNYAKILSKYCKPGKVLDVGCAAGFILKGYEQAGWKGFGIEPNHTMVEYGRKKLKLNIVKADLETFITEERFDLISLIQVIGHFHNLEKSLQTIGKLLKSDGYVIVESWDMDSLFAKLMGKHWHEYSPPSVVNWFSDSTIKHLFSVHGFELVSKGRPKKKVSLQHGISLIRETTPNIIFKDKILNLINKNFGKYALPYPPMDLKWYLFKKK